MSIKNFGDFIDPSRKDIWRYAQLFEKTEKRNRVDAQQSDFTPIERVGNWLVKREDRSSTGSHKFRSLAFQLSCLLEENVNKAVLSSSGNAAIAASKLLPENANLKLFVFLSKKTPLEKLAAIKFTKNLISIFSSRPLRLAKYAIKHFNLKDLRPSKDPNAVIGFRSLGFEIFEQAPNIKNIFSFATSGASIRGIAEAYKFLLKSKIIKRMPRIFAVSSTGRLAGNLSGQQTKERTANKNLCSADSIQRVDVSDSEILLIQQKYPHLKTSHEGLASLAAAEKIKSAGESLVILTGRIWPKKRPDLNKFFEAENFADVDRMIF